MKIIYYALNCILKALIDTTIYIENLNIQNHLRKAYHSVKRLGSTKFAITKSTVKGTTRNYRKVSSIEDTKNSSLKRKLRNLVISREKIYLKTKRKNILTDFR